jgi:outer membrane protein TolC
VAVARVEADRAAVALRTIERESQAAILRATRERDGAAARLERDRQLLSAAERLAGMVTTAYREGAYPITSVLEARRTVRDVQREAIDDAAALALARAALLLATTGTGAR